MGFGTGALKVCGKGPVVSRCNNFFSSFGAADCVAARVSFGASSPFAAHPLAASCPLAPAGSLTAENSTATAC